MVTGLSTPTRVQVDVGDGEALQIDLSGMRLTDWLPRVDVPVRVTWTLAPTTQRLRIDGRVRLHGLASLLLVPGQHLGGGRVVIDALIAAAGLSGAVVGRDNTGLDLDLAKVPGHACGLRLTALTLLGGTEPGLAGTFQLT